MMRLVNRSDESARGPTKFLYLYGALVIYSMVTVCSKLASSYAIPSGGFLLFLGLEIAALAVYAIVWQQAISHFSIVFAISNKGLVVILGLVWSVLLFKEAISVFNIVGAAVIVVGVWIVSADG